ncbi:TerC family protein [Paralimibaculum aggregatum]|uniref:TerC family protein n=1 Tax=Paralimibaculum aggregatum TaxID=3036245 RepID=A0ABQ6LTA9_9RHOB|nr:TerC family protein [Limibaculum sp. NKW23]GMG85302.1 TerC family protein [Limibaculum sp. NKW23]
MDFAHLIADPAAWVALATLIVMEVVLGIDNLLFISVLTNKLPEAQRPAARRIGLTLALVFRLALLASIAWIVSLSEPVLSLLGKSFSWRDLILLAGGFFLVWKATTEIRAKVDPDPEAPWMTGRAAERGMMAAIGQIVLLDLVFSVDSILTAVGMTQHIEIMVVAVVVAVLLMLLAAAPLAAFVEAHPTVTMLALGFLLMIGTVLMAEGFGFHVPKGYVYTAMAFSAAIEALNILRRRRRGTAVDG